MKHLQFQILLLKRLGIILLVFSLLRVLFFLFNEYVFSGSASEVLTAFVAGLRFDIAVIITINLLFILLHLLPFRFRFQRWYQKLTAAVFYLFNLPAFILAIADFKFYKFNGKRISADLFGVSTVFLKMLPHFIIDFWYLFVILASVIVFTVYLYKKTNVFSPNSQLPTLNPGKYFLIQLVLLIVFTPLLIIGMRGGTQKHPLSALAACKYVDVSKIAFVTNTPFEFIQSIAKRGIERKQYFTDEEAKKRFPIEAAFNHREPLKYDNVIIIILESFSKEFIGTLNQDAQNSTGIMGGLREYNHSSDTFKTYTPFLDSLIPHSLAFTNAYANGWRSMQAVVSVMASIPALMDEPFTYSKYQDDKVYGLGTILKSIGYTTSFFHGGDNGEFRFDMFSRAAGFDHYYGRNEFNNEKEFDGNYGIYDEAFFQYLASETDKMKEPFCSVIFSLSSHDPYRIPSKYKNKFPKGPETISESIGYSDYSLRQFFHTASTKKWYNNTLFVITADHVDSKHADYYADRRNDFFSIPILFYKNNSELKGMAKYPIQQIDILPSILDHVKYNGKFISFGKSVFDSTSTRYTYEYLNGVYYINDSNFILLFDGSNTMGLYSYHSGNDLKEMKEYEGDRVRLENQVKAVIQAHNNGLIENKLSLQ